MEDVPPSYSCCDCQRRFPSLPELLRHRELLHPPVSPDTEESDGIPRPYRCQQCGRGYRHPGSLVNHRRTHETGLFPCTTCGKDFTNPMALKSHIRTHVPEGRRRRRPPRPKEDTPCFQGETMSTDSWGQKLEPDEDWESPTKHTEETPDCESGPEPRAAPDTWEDPSQREDWESKPDPEEDAKPWAATTNSDRPPPLPAPASSLLSNLEQYLAESVVNFTGGQEPTRSTPAEEERRYKCSQCGKTYKHAGSLTNHRQSHTVGIYPCAICFKEFSNLMALKNHSRLHAQYRPYRCPRCPRAFRLPRELLEHQQSHEGEGQESLWDEKGMPTTNGHVDESSRNQFSALQMLNSSGELEDSGLEEYRPFRCGECGRTYRHAGSLINHRKSHQTGIYPCPVCSKHLFNAAALKNHVRAHHKPRQGPSSDSTVKDEDGSTTPVDYRPYKCNECGRAYRHRGSLVNHRHTHRTGEYQCSLCPRKYTNLMALRNHVRVHCKAARRGTGPGAKDPPSHGNTGAEAAPRLDQRPGCKREEGATDVPAAADGTAPQICSVCGMMFEDPASLEHHSQSHREGKGENDQAETRVSPPRTFACQDCGKSYRHSSSLVNHRQTHQTGDFSCGACAKHFHTMAAMKNHMRLHSHRRSRRHRRRASSAGGGGGAKFPSAKDWDQELVDDSENPDFPQDLSGESTSSAEGTEGGDCLQTASVGDKRGLERGEACLQGEKGSRGSREGGERKESRGHGSLNMSGVQQGRGARFCDGLAEVNEDQKPATDVRKPTPHSADTVTGWQAEAAHTCADCGRSFPHAIGLLSHRPCHPPGIYQCSLCPKEFDSLPALRSHFRNHRPGEASSAQPFLCCLCGMIFPGRAGYRLHRRQAHSCSGMTEGSEEEGEEEGAAEVATTRSPPLQLSEAELLNQLQREVEALDGAGYGHICGCCGQTYDDLGSLERHHRSLGGAFGNAIDKAPSPLGESGNGTEMVTDDVCEGTDSSVSGEGADMKYGEGVGATVADSLCMQGGENSLEAQSRPFRCNLCGKTYRHGGSLVNHRKIHQTGDFTCPVCSRCYPNLAAFRNHLRNHPRCKGSEPQVGPIPEVKGSSEPQNTAEAGLGWRAKVEKLQEELKVEPPEEVVRVKEEAWEETTVTWEETELRLETADKGCQTEASSERPFSCEVCGRSYKHAGSLINHRQSHQTGHFGCQACSKGFSNLMSLKNHRRIHADPRRFRCGECGKAFRLQKQLASHQRVHVEHGVGGSRKRTREDRPFCCGQCGRTYRHAGSLLNHQRSHETGQYSCPSCPKTCSNLTTLKDHQRLHSESCQQWAGLSQRAAVYCALCGQGFTSQVFLEQHLWECEETKRELANGQEGPGGTGGSEGTLQMPRDWRADHVIMRQPLS